MKYAFTNMFPGYTRTLASHFAEGHRNNFDFVRFFAACLVLFGHSFTMLESTPQFKYPSDPVTNLIHPYLPFGQGLPGTGVHIFFFVSGLLVTQSFLRRCGLWGFAKARLLRIVPAFWVNTLLMALVLGPLMTEWPLAQFLSSRVTWEYIFLNLPFWPQQVHLPGVFQNIPFAPAVNGSIWTLPLELQMYGWVVLLGLAGALARRRAFALLFTVLLIYFAVTGKSYMFLTSTGEPRLWVFFFWGIFACLYADRLPISPRLLGLAALPVAALWPTDSLMFQIVAAGWFSYALLVFAYWRYLPALDLSRYGDFSYGIYLYCFPVQQTLISFILPHYALSGWELAPLTFLVTLPIAAASWYLVEKPALALKKRAMPATPAPQMTPVNA